jgi:hypothetical protein
MTLLAPMIAGPTIRLPVTLALGSIRTRPMMSLASSTSPSIERSSD